MTVGGDMPLLTTKRIQRLGLSAFVCFLAASGFIYRAVVLRILQFSTLPPPGFRFRQALRTELDGSSRKSLSSPCLILCAAYMANPECPMPHNVNPGSCRTTRLSVLIPTDRSLNRLNCSFKQSG